MGGKIMAEKTCRDPKARCQLCGACNLETAPLIEIVNIRSITICPSCDRLTELEKLMTLKEEIQNDLENLQRFLQDGAGRG